MVQMEHTVVTPCPASPAADHHFRRALLLSLCPLNGDGINYGLRRILGVVVVGGFWGLLPVLRILRRRNGVPLLVWDAEGTLWADRCGAGDGDGGGDVVRDGRRGWRGSHVGRGRTGPGSCTEKQSTHRKKQIYVIPTSSPLLLQSAAVITRHLPLTSPLVCCPSSCLPKLPLRRRQVV